MKFLNSTVEFEKNDGRPAITTDSVQNISLNGVKVERSTGANDLQWRKSSGTSVTDSTTTSGQALRVKNG